MDKTPTTPDELRKVCVNFGPTDYYIKAKLWTMEEMLMDWVILRNAITPAEAFHVVEGVLKQIAKMELRND